MSIVDGATLRRFAAIVQVRGEDLKLKIEDGLEKRDLNLATDASDTATDERGEQTLNKMRSGHHVCHCKAERDGRLRRVSVEVREAGE